MKILHVIGGLNRGGAEAVVVNLCNAASAAGHDVAICSLMDSIPMVDRLRPDARQNVFTCGRQAGSFPPMRNQVSSFRKLKGVISTFQPTIVHSHLYSYVALLQWAASVGSGTRHVVTFHTAGLHYGRRRHLPSFAFRSLESANAALCAAKTVAVSRAVADVVAKGLWLRRDRLSVVYNGVDIDSLNRARISAIDRRALGLPPDALVVACLGRMHEVKGHGVLIEAWKVVARQQPRARLLLIGDGPLRETLEATVRAARMTESVRFLGQRDDVPALLSTVDLGVVPSLYEGLPMAVLEMMCLGIPVVGSDIPALAEVLQPPECGVVVPPKASRALAERVLEVLEDEAMRKRLGGCGRRRVQRHFTLAAQAAAYDEIYRS